MHYEKRCSVEVSVKRKRTYVEGRRQQVLAALRENPKLRVDELAEKFDVSVVTMRRDLQTLQEEQQILRFYGGARLIDGAEGYVEGVSIYRDAIARYAASLVGDGDSLFINTSRNALQMVNYIAGQNVTVITNNGKAISYEKRDGINIILTGGELRYPKESMVGDFAIKNLQNIFAKKAFVGCSGISVKTGMTTEIASEVSINQLMIEHTLEEVYLLADHTKIGHSSSFTSCGVDMIKHLITDELAPEEELNLLRERGVIIHQVKQSDFYGTL